MRASLQHDHLTAARASHIARELMETGRAAIATISGANQSWDVTMEAFERFQKEGDWTLCIHDAEGTRLVSCSFCLASLGGRTGRPKLLIGCIQGPDTSVDGRMLYRCLTRKWLGLRPKPLAIFLAQSLARAMGAKTALILSNEAHVYSSWRYLFRKRRIKADYHALAQDCGARRDWHVLPMPHHRLAEDAAGKDAVRRTRHALQAALDEQILDSVQGRVTNPRT
ncbi:DUF535 family protein [Paraburkholderia sp. A2WS-5]|uniref:DUF535 family protein n=1 Tax=unclassified Paraburkholderia TaxID=2615204 RepID=UPI003B79E601